MSKQLVREAFDVFDPQGTGYVSADKLRNVMTNLSANLNDEEIDQLISSAEVGDDGKICYREIVKVLAEKCRGVTPIDY